ncbi:cytochrome P450 714A1-like [Macadamia integrifolia]|uniref:cytochrome P450 714A1-like n=1 Tax=Macadamia integrifolia TaxID=60698 RepID=UPI001C4F4E0A|nr:cytochrome P450 714A1-like [Macadamia integrifolia]
MEASFVKVLWSLCLMGFCSLVGYIFNVVWMKPERLRQKLRRQGVTGPPPYSFLVGNVPEMTKIKTEASKINQVSDHGDIAAHDYTASLFPYFECWRKQYGLVYMYSTGRTQHLYVNHPDMVKEIGQVISYDLGKPLNLANTLSPLLGKGVLTSNGHLWSHQRKIISAEFFMDKVKGMMGLMVESGVALMEKWERRVVDSEGGIAEIKVDEDLRDFSADVISRACFGSSYSQGKDIFSKIRVLEKMLSEKGFLHKGSTFRNLPTKNNRDVWKLEREIKSLILKTVKEREEKSLGNPSLEKDLLQMLLEGAKSDKFSTKESNRFIVDNCKNIYFAGHETTAVAAAWCLMLLGLYPKWQDRVRQEVAQVCRGGSLDADALRKMKMVEMVIQETLRLYPPGAFISRETLKDTKLGDLIVPKGIRLWTLIPTLHRDPDIWGSDANEFNPSRFENGISDACKYPQTFVPFGTGPRLCLGRNFALSELKILLSLMVSKFSFSVSPKYQHCPKFVMIVEPKYGVDLLIRKI